MPLHYERPLLCSKVNNRKSEMEIGEKIYCPATYIDPYIIIMSFSLAIHCVLHLLCKLYSYIDIL